jgi:ribosomal protein S21
MFENVHLLCQNESILQRNIKRTHIIKEFSLKKYRKYEHINHTQKTRIKKKKKRNFKTLEIQMMFQNY